MAKKIKDSDGNVYVQKNPFYKRGWFWTLIAVVVLLTVMISAIGGSSNDNDNSAQAVSSSSTDKSSVSSSTQQEKTTFKVGETVDYKGADFKVTEVSYPTGEDFEQPDQGKQYIVFKVTITNKSDEKLDYNPYYFKINDKGNQVDANNTPTDIKTLDSGTLTKGGSVTGYLGGQITKGDKVQLVYLGDGLSDSDKFSLDIN
ncbi:DUF4352 domain-containing protein [Periweissella fabalis]|uniref:DUF4352 domain-containing protein n=1 Tax=Periweissella fabalis TaxID=1070421 RepID=A0A7X6N3D5_9LACO|nr:DUF4352 domain-containing protein [Periweissella fabalis]MCM0598326.1 DUF4352 domain-containing protein [Periweissella fabalis]NKZ24958.1 DUF4352 domain-containing protein [Periweissella fabalis]